MMRLFLARHGLTDWNDQSRFQGQTDVQLNEQGRRQAHALALRLAGETFHAIYASDLQRAWQTAQRIRQQQIASDPKPMLISEPGLREIHFGDWEGLTYSEIQKADPESLTAWEADIINFAPPGGENLKQLAERVKSILYKLVQVHQNETILLVAHGGPLQTLISLSLNLPPEMYWHFHLAPASLTELGFYPAGTIINSLNDTCHLKEGKPWDT